MIFQGETCLADRIYLISSEYRSITGESLNARIFDWLSSAGYPLTEQDFRVIFAKVPAPALNHLSGLLEREMKSDRVREALNTRSQSEPEPIVEDGEDFEYEPVSIEYSHTIEVEVGPLTEHESVSEEDRIAIEKQLLGEW